MIRKYKQQDLDELIQIWLEASIIAHNFIPSNFWILKVEEMKEVYIPQSDTTVFTDDATGEIQGFISLVDTFIAALFVNPQKQGKGIGTSLLNWVKQHHDTLELAVYKENDKSYRYYLGQNFKVVELKQEENTEHFEYIMRYIKE